jgi:elongation factor 1-gamma
MSELRIFSYLPNPRIWKATIAGRLCGVEVEVRGASPKELQNWLWDFDARPLSKDEQGASKDVRVGKVGFKGGRLYKTEAFLEAHPFGTVPAAFSPDGHTGIFESNSIMRAVARLGERTFPLYGNDAYEASRIDSFLDASLGFARDAQLYLLSFMSGAVPPEVHARASDAFTTYMGGIEQALSPDRQYIVGNNITLADICFVAELCLFANEKTRGKALHAQKLAPILHTGLPTEFPRAIGHFDRLCRHPAFAQDVEPYLRKIETEVNETATSTR